MFTLLAVAQQKTAHEWAVHPSYWPGQGDVLTWCNNMDPGSAVLLIIFGLVYLLLGWKVFRWLVTFSAVLVGAAVGAAIGEKAGATWVGVLLGATFCGIMAWMFTKFAVAVLGGIYGALLGASLWRMAGLDIKFAWSGALTGLVLFGLLSFIIFRISIIMYTSLQGAVMLVFGIMGMIYKYKSVSGDLSSSMNSRPYLLPLAIFIPVVFGFIYQQLRYPGAANASPAPAAPAKK